MAKYSYIKFLIVQLYLTLLSRFGYSYEIPQVRLQALSPKGLRASIPDQRGVKIFGFYGSVNNNIAQLDPGDFNQKDVMKATNGLWVYEDLDVVLQEGDIVSYWVYVQHENISYSKDGQSWQVKKLETAKAECIKSETFSLGKQACVGQLIFEDNFDRLENNDWTPQKYYPSYFTQNYEFNYYSPESVKVENSKLIITPLALLNENDIRGTLNLTNGCTSKKFNEECIKEYTYGLNYLPPVRSGEVYSKFTFKYGRIEFDAKLPCGDWIYPEITLLSPQDIYKNKSNIILAYALGNAVLKSNLNNNDIGGSVLFSGFSPVEQNNKHLSKITINSRLCKANHKFKVIWNKNKIYSYLDNFDTPYGVINTDDFENYIDSEYYIRLGVSVGGHRNFPDCHITTNNRPKPWTNYNLEALHDFFKDRNQWFSTWQPDVSLEIDKLKIYAL